MKKIILSGIIILAVLGVYYTGIYTYFIKDEISEKLPEMAPVISGESLPQIKTIKQGEFVNSDFFHKGSGRAMILEYPDGKKILRFENFQTINGPDLYVYLSKTNSPTGDLKNLGDFMDLGRLKGNVGDQNYDLGGDIAGYNSVVIWCKKFGVLFPYAVIK